MPKEVINVNTVNPNAEKETFWLVDFIIYTIITIFSTIFTSIIVVASLRLWRRLRFQWEKKLNPWRKKNPLINSLIIGICALGLFLVIIMLLTCEGGVFAILLGTDSKKETIEFIAFGIGGLLAVIGAIAINHRAEAQVENNKLIEKGHIDERFKSATENLESESPMARISAFHQFYYWAKDQQDTEFKKSIFEILCAHLRNMTQETSYREETGKDTPTEECQTLLNVLFGPKYCTVFDNNEFGPDLQKVYLVKAELTNAKLLRANLSNANLSGANLSNANLSNARLSRANLSDAWLLYTNLSDANLLFTNFSEAWLIEANFSGAQLLHANLPKTKLMKGNLSNANLSYANLSNANLSGAQILCANFSKTTLLNIQLSDANLTDTNLSGADLSGADLSGANFMVANLINADLPGADLSGADLSGTNLSSANLQKTQLKDANLMDVFNIQNADFRGAKIGDRPITKDDLPADKGEYYADWNPPPKKEEN